MTAVETRPRDVLPESVERAVALLLSSLDGESLPRPPGSGADLREWMADQPDVELALGRLVAQAGGQLTRSAAPKRAHRAPIAGPSPMGRPSTPLVPGIPVSVRPVVDVAGPDTRAETRLRIGLWVRNLGAIVLLFLAYQLWGTGFQQRRSQARLAAVFQKARPAGADSPLVAGNNSTGTDGSLPRAGDVVARLQIPALGLDQYVVEGTDESDLQKGPGHYRGSPLPGQPGNAAIAGHRTTYGAPFVSLDQLKPGDTILATTSAGTFLYDVSGKMTVAPSDSAVVGDYGDNRLTLTTCTPKFSSSARLIVVAALEGPASASNPAHAAPPPPLKTHLVNDDSPAAAQLRRTTSREFDVGALLPAVFWASFIVGLALLYRPMRRRIPPLATFVLMAPLWLCGLVLLFEQLNRFLPPNV